MDVRSLSIIVPAYNEERTIHEVLGVVCALRLPQGIRKEVIVVNDRSKDGTSAEVSRFISDNPQAGVVLVEQPVNRGKGAAIHRGMQEATGDMLIIQDADVELDPNEIPKLLEPVSARRSRCGVRRSLRQRFALSRIQQEELLREQVPHLVQQRGYR
jgi:glycosyltransferase involved in cell wall biosynthesis